VQPPTSDWSTSSSRSTKPKTSKSTYRPPATSAAS
jgi:hypothetical protein